MSDRYIIVVTGRFTDETASQACQVFERHADFNYHWYEPVRHAENSPLPMGKARERLAKLQEDDERCSPDCTGIVLDASFKPPQGWVSIERCDDCLRFKDDFAAASSISKRATFLCIQCTAFAEDCDHKDGTAAHRWRVVVPFDDAEKAGLVKREIPGNEEVHWEIILCWDTGSWTSAFVQADNEDQIHEYLKKPQFDRVAHYQLIGPDDGWNWPTEEGWDNYVDLGKKEDEDH